MHSVSNQVNLFNDIFNCRNKLLRAIVHFDDIDIIAACLDNVNDGSQGCIVEGKDTQPDNIVLVVGTGRQLRQFASRNTEIGGAQLFGAGGVIDALEFHKDGVSLVWTGAFDDMARV